MFAYIFSMFQVLRGVRARARLNGVAGTLQYSIFLVLDSLILWTKVYVMKFWENNYDYDFCILNKKIYLNFWAVISWY